MENFYQKGVAHGEDRRRGGCNDALEVFKGLEDANNSARIKIGTESGMRDNGAWKMDCCRTIHVLRISANGIPPRPSAYFTDI